jgi:hypothetical protein
MRRAHPLANRRLVDKRLTGHQYPPLHPKAHQPRRLHGRSAGSLRSNIPPDFADVDDILEGRRRILVVNDLVLSSPEALQNTSTDVLWTFKMDRSFVELGSPTQETLVAPDCTITPPYPYPAQTRIARMFNLENDAIVTLAPKSTATGWGCSSPEPNMVF